MTDEERVAPAQSAIPGAQADWQVYAGQLRAARERLQNLKVDDPAIPACVAGLSQIEEMLRRPLRIVVLGEYNSGKTSVTGLMIGKGLLPVSVLSNTGIPVHVGYGPQPALYGIDQNGVSIRIDGTKDDPLTDLTYHAVDIRLPMPWLQRHQILDTPATLTPGLFAADADIAIWCTVATRAWTESERNLWSAMPPRVHQNAVLVATHKDSFYSDEDCDQVLRRLMDMTSGLFRSVILVSAATPINPIDYPGDPSGDSAIIHAAIDASSHTIRERRRAKAQRIVQRLARLALHEFGRHAIRPESETHFKQWSALSDRILDDQRAHRLTRDQSLGALLHTFAEVAENLQPGVIMPARAPSHVNGHAQESSRVDGTFTNPAALRADLTAVLRILATASPYESPQSREQRQAARATLVALADLDAILEHVGRWLKANHTPTDHPGDHRHRMS